MDDDDFKKLVQVITAVLIELDHINDVVICSDNPQVSATKIAAAVKSIVPHTGLTHMEMAGIKSLIFYAVANKSFFDWEMPILTGFNAEGFKKIAEKLPRE